MDDSTPTDVHEADPVDPTDDPFAVCEMIADCVDLLDQRGPVGEPLRRVELWQAAAAAHDALGVVVHQIAADAVDALASSGHEEATTRFGPVHLEPGYAREEWQGHRLLGDMSETVITADGEQVPAVRLDLLREVIPSCSDPDHTSSKWKATALHAAGYRVKTYRSKADPPDVIRRGPKAF
jgi:hypothetical protein